MVTKCQYPELYDEAKDICADIIAERGLPLKSGARELLSYLKERDIKVGLASSTSYKGVIKNLKGAGLLDYFHVIIGGDMIKHSKPQPEIYLLACEKLGVTPEKTVAVEELLQWHKGGLQCEDDTNNGARSYCTDR